RFPGTVATWPPFAFSREQGIGTGECAVPIPCSLFPIPHPYSLSVGNIPDDRRALHLAHAGPVVLDRVVLRAAVVPERKAVLAPAEAHLVFRNLRLADQVVEEVARARREIEPATHVLRRVIVDEVRRVRVDEQDLLSRLGMRAHHRMLDLRMLL